MKKYTVLFLLILISISTQAQEKYHKVEIKTSAVCEMCQYAIEKEMAFEKGVKSAILDLETKNLLVTYHANKTSVEQIRKRIALTGYHADSIRRDSIAYKNLPLCCKDGAHSDEHIDEH
ncbi:MAG: heavy-metal-associated domain-containing protein [Cyclobacteriaceae bacterium]